MVTIYQLIVLKKKKFCEESVFLCILKENVTIDYIL